MKLDVVFAPQGLCPADVAGRTVFVIDVLRATTTICAALANGARAVVPAATSEDAVRMAQSVGTRDALLCGERNCVRIEGFALGNSPREMTPDVVQGKLIVHTTSNGTGALLATQGARAVFAAAAVNLSLAGARAEQALAEEQDLLILCAGRAGAFGLDDAYVAGRLALAALGGHRVRRGLNDAALASLDLVRRYGDTFLKPFSYSEAGRHLARLGMADDVRLAARLDAFPVLPLFRERRLTIAPAAVPA